LVRQLPNSSQHSGLSVQPIGVGDEMGATLTKMSD
jgi:hypothetical protein